jgi:prolyl-tRNA synthetase
VRGALVVVDDAVAGSPNLVAGANQPGYHLLNVNCGRDFQPDLVVDIAAAREGDGCPQCGAPLGAERGVEVGNIFQLGTKYTQALGGYFLDAEGKSQPVIMGSYGIGVGRLLACVAEAHHDDKGLVWPATVAPFDVHIVAVAKQPGPVLEAAQRLYADLRTAGLQVLLDDRPETPGVKFNDADLLGMPVRVDIGERSLKKGVVECKLRREADRREVPLEQAAAHVHEAVQALRAELAARVQPVAYKE